MTEIEALAVEIIKQERTRWEDATCFVTEKVAFNMRPLIRLARKNYWGIFDQERDPITKQKKIWVPLTEMSVEQIVKSIDLDQKDIRFRAKNAKGIPVTEVLRQHVKDKLDKMFFGEYLDEMERALAIDGTAVWKIIETTDKEGRKTFKPQLVNLLNFYIDPTARSIQETGAVIERAVLTWDEFQSFNGWSNKSMVQARHNIDKNEPMVQNLNTNSDYIPEVEIFERWGVFTKFLITGEKSDRDKYVEGHIVASNIDDNPVIHLIEENKKGVRPYEECWYTRVPGRWYGRGPAEKVMGLQIYANEVINIRRNRARVSQLGIFTLRDGSGITAQQLSYLAANGVLKVKNHDDIMQLPMKEASEASYKDEEIIKDWSQRLTSAFDVVTGEGMPSSTPATNAAIQDRNATSTFVLVKEGIGMFLQRVFDRHALPILTKGIKKKDIIRLATSEEGMQALIERVVSQLAIDELNKMYSQGVVPDAQSFSLAFQSAQQRLVGQSDLFVDVLEEILASDFDTVMYVTNEEVDVAVTVQNLIGILPAAPEYRDPIIKEVFNLLGLNIPPTPPPQMPQGPQAQGQPSQPGDVQAPTQTNQSITTGANVPALAA